MRGRAPGLWVLWQTRLLVRAQTTSVAESFLEKSLAFQLQNQEKDVTCPEYVSYFKGTRVGIGPHFKMAFHSCLLNWSSTKVQYKHHRICWLKHNTYESRKKICKNMKRGPEHHLSASYANAKLVIIAHNLYRHLSWCMGLTSQITLTSSAVTVPLSLPKHPFESLP